jgi:hypothetical protein
MVVEIPTEIDSEAAEEVPGWVKNTAGWWAEDKIHDITFVAGIKYLIGKGIMVVEQEVEEAEELVEEVVEIKDFFMELNGANCCTNWAYVGKEYRFQIETFDDSGSPIDGVTITAKIISKGGELRHNFGEVTTEDGFYKNSITIPNMDWYAGNILSVTGEYYGVEKTIEKEFEVLKKTGTSGNYGMSAGSCAYVAPVSVNSQESNPGDIAFSKSGEKMFILGPGSAKVHEYTLTSAYCIGEVSFVDSFDVSSQETKPKGIAFSKSGEKMFIVGRNSDAVIEYTLTTAFDVSSASFVDSFSVQSQVGQAPEDVVFSESGEKMFVVGSSDPVAVNEYTLATAWDVSSASHVHQKSLSSQDENPRDIAFSKSGEKMFILGDEGNDVNEYTLTTAFDVSSASFVDSFSVGSQEAKPEGIWFDSSGNTMFIVGTESGSPADRIYAYKLTTGWDVSSASFGS